MVQKFKPQRKDDEVRIKMDITVDLPAELAEQAEQMGIYEFDRCVYDENTRLHDSQCNHYVLSEGSVIL